MSEIQGANGRPSKVGRTAPATGGSLPAAFAELTRAVRLHQNGDLDAAEAIYRQVHKTDPRNADALQFLGVIAHQRGDSGGALKSLRKALRLEPENTSCHNNLGNVYAALGEDRKAAYHFRKAGAGRHGSTEALANLAVLTRRAGKPQEALEVLRKAQKLDPKAPAPHREMGGIFLELRQYPEAEAALRDYLALQPDDVMALNNLAYAVQQQQRFLEAEELFSRALAISAGAPEIGHNVRISLLLQGRADEARDMLRNELQKNPDIWTAEVGLALNIAARGHLDHALTVLEQILEALPDRANVWADIGLVYLNLGRHEEAIRVLKRAVELDPGEAVPYNTLGASYSLALRADLAIGAFKSAIKAKPDFIEPYVNICRALRTIGDYDQANLYGHLALNHEKYEPRFFPNMIQLFRGTCDFAGLEKLGDVWSACDQVADANLPAIFLDLLVFARERGELEKFFALVRRWASYMEELAALAPAFPAPRRKEGRKLRIGFLSSDLRSHSVSRFLIPLMRGYDKDRFEFYCYMSIRDLGDPIQETFKSAVDRFIFVDNQNKWEIARTINAGQVDILFDLNGFTEGTMVHALAYRPAPVQISWLGYPFTCGLRTIDHVVMDRFVVPDDGKYLVEEPIIMPEAWVCFGKFADVPITQGLPMDSYGALTFGTLNNPYKYTPHMIANWAKVMREVPNSRFLMVRPEARSPTVCRNVATEFGRHGIAPERLYFFDNKRERRNHLAYYNEIDISLDTFPLTGGTTTCEATWMGVPVVSLVGEAFQQRISYSALMQCGLEELCTFDEDSFVQTAVALAGDRPRLSAYRQGMREIMAASPLCDHDRFIHQFQEMLEQVAQHHNLR